MRSNLCVTSPSSGKDGLRQNNSAHCNYWFVLLETQKISKNCIRRGTKQSKAIAKAGGLIGWSLQFLDRIGNFKYTCDRAIMLQVKFEGDQVLENEQTKWIHTGSAMWGWCLVLGFFFYWVNQLLKAVVVDLVIIQCQVTSDILESLHDLSIRIYNWRRGQRTYLSAHSAMAFWVKTSSNLTMISVVCDETCGKSIFFRKNCQVFPGILAHWSVKRWSPPVVRLKNVRNALKHAYRASLLQSNGALKF